MSPFFYFKNIVPILLTKITIDMKDLEKAFSKENLKRSWKWLNSSSKLDYKNYFRNHYNAYAISTDENLADLRFRLMNGIYSPSHPVKIYLPKKSGILRPFTILTIEDQIVYQALVNIIAEKLYPKAHLNYDLLNFGNQYTSTRSRFFLKDWKKGYRRFNKNIEDAFNDGLQTTATFDLTAFYDSIDYKVLSQLLIKLGFTNDFTDRLVTYLEVWSCPNHQNCIDNNEEIIYHGHGIPQGPMASGILSEVMMNYIDEEFKKSIPTTRYLRYVDDIRLMGLDEYGIKKSLMHLDLLSKKLGLFPQPSKINIHKIDDLSKEIKSLSIDPEIKDTEELIDGNVALEKIDKILKRGKFANNETAIKFLIGIAKPNSKLSRRLIKLLKTHSHFYETILRYFEKHKSLSKPISELLIQNLKEENLYEEVTAKYLLSLINNVHKDCFELVMDYCLIRFKTIEEIYSPNLKAAIISWLLRGFHIKYIQLEALLKDSSDWVTQSVLHLINVEHYGKPSYEELINSLLEKENSDTAMNAAYLCIINDLNIRSKKINNLAQIPLFNLGKIKNKTPRISTIQSSLEWIFGKGLEALNWNKFLGRHKLKAETQIFICKVYSQTNATAFVNQLDVFNDMLLDALYQIDSSLGKYNLGKIGGVKNSTRLQTDYPNFLIACNLVHELRLNSELSHPYSSKSGKKTKRISFYDLSRIRKKLKAGYIELVEKVNIKMPVKSKAILI